MSYFGGKGGAGVYQTIINQIPPHDHYIEPFLGGGSIMRHKRPSPRSTGVERCGDVVAEWIRDPVPGLELHHCDGIEWLRHFFGFYCASRNNEPTAGNAGRRDSRAAASQNNEPTAASQNNEPTAGDAGRRDSRFFVYCDPPYPLATRKSHHRYRYEMTADDHQRLLATICALPANVAISSYPNEVYEAALQDWRRLEFPATTRGGKLATEVLWMNYEQPSELHDYRYLGANKRQREKLRRRIRNLQAAASRLPELQRRAFIQSLTG